MASGPLRTSGGALLRAALVLAVRVVVGLAVLVGATATLALTIPRMGEPSSKWGLALVAVTPIGLLSAIVLVAGALAGAWLAGRARRGRRRTLGGVAALGLVAVLVHAVWLAPLYVGSRPAAAAGKALVVLAQNAEGADMAAVAAAVRDRDVDVLVLSDLGPTEAAAIEASTIPTELPRVSAPGDGPTVYSRYPLTERATGAGATGDAGTRPPYRDLLVETPMLGSVRLVAAHPAAPYDSAGWAADYRRLESALADTATPEGLPTIVAGDLNATPDHAPLRRIRALGFSDAAEQTRGGLSPTWPAPGERHVAGVAIPTVAQIDHVLTTRQLVVTDLSNIAPAGADHLGVLAVIHRSAG